MDALNSLLRIKYQNMAQYVRKSLNSAPQICYQYIFSNYFAIAKSWVVLNSFGMPSSGAPVGIAMLPVSDDYQQIPNQSQIIIF